MQQGASGIDAVGPHDWRKIFHGRVEQHPDHPGGRGGHPHLEALRPVYLWDRLYLGGGNSRRITSSTLGRLNDDVIIVPNSAGIIGGVRAWNLMPSGSTRD